MAPRAGFEPATNRLTAGCSTTELPGNRAKQSSQAPAYNKAIGPCKAEIGRPGSVSRTTEKRSRRSLFGPWQGAADVRARGVAMSPVHEPDAKTSQSGIMVAFAGSILEVR